MGLSKSNAAKLELMLMLLGGQKILDEDGNDTGEVTAQIITKEEAIGLLDWEPNKERKKRRGL